MCHYYLPYRQLFDYEGVTKFEMVLMVFLGQIVHCISTMLRRGREKIPSCLFTVLVCLHCNPLTPHKFLPNVPLLSAFGVIFEDEQRIVTVQLKKCQK